MTEGPPPTRPADVMERTQYTFKVRQRVHYYPEGRASNKMTGPWVVVGLVRQPDGDVRYRIRSRSNELIAREEELKLVLARGKDYRQLASEFAAPSAKGKRQ
jgi:hypothetical protein